MEKQEEEGEYFGKKKNSLTQFYPFRKAEIIIYASYPIFLSRQRAIARYSVRTIFIREGGGFFLTSSIFSFCSCAVFHTCSRRRGREGLYGNATIAGSHGTIARSKSIILYVSLKRWEARYRGLCQFPRAGVGLTVETGFGKRSRVSVRRGYFLARHFVDIHSLARRALVSTYVSLSLA